MIDTHCHLYDEQFDQDREETRLRALEAGVEMMLLPAIDSTTSQRQQTLQQQHPEQFRSMVGLHPTSVKEDFENELALVKNQLDHRDETIVAIGEIGLDFYWDRTFETQQLETLRQQMIWSDEYQLPVALHVRKAHNEFFNLMRDLGKSTYRGVMHCFGGSVQEAQRAVEMGFYIGIGGVVTFKNATMAQVAATIPLERILIETDAPYLAPVPHRGHRNEPAFVADVARTIATIRSIPFETVAQTTTQNAKQLFRLV